MASTIYPRPYIFALHKWKVKTLRYAFTPTGKVSQRKGGMQWYGTNQEDVDLKELERRMELGAPKLPAGYRWGPILNYDTMKEWSK